MPPFSMLVYVFSRSAKSGYSTMRSVWRCGRLKSQRNNCIVLGNCQSECSMLLGNYLESRLKPRYRALHLTANNLYTHMFQHKTDSRTVPQRTGLARVPQQRAASCSFYGRRNCQHTARRFTLLSTETNANTMAVVNICMWCMCVFYDIAAQAIQAVFATPKHTTEQ